MFSPEQWQVIAQACPELVRATVRSGFSAAMASWKSVLVMRLFDGLPKPVRDLLQEAGTDIPALIGLRLWVERRGVEATLAEMRKAIAESERLARERIERGLPYE